MADADPNASDSSRSPDRDASDFTLDLSTGKAPSRRTRKTKGHIAVVQKTINLSTPKSEKPAEATKEPKASGAPSRSKKNTSGGGRRKERSAPRSGNSLADLLDPETLARLRGE